MIFDLHTHTNLSSCSELDIHDLIVTGGRIGLDGICITDHQTMDIRHYINEGVQSNGLIVLFGMEYETQDGDFLLFGPYEDLPQGMEAENLLRHVDSTRGVAVAAHPFRKDRPMKKCIVQSGLCSIIESMNGRNTEIENLQIAEWRKQYNLFEVGGSDAHTSDELGRVVTHFSAPVQSRTDLVHALRHGRCRPEWRDN